MTDTVATIARNTPAPARAYHLACLARPSVMDHGDGAGLIAGTGREKAPELLARLVLCGRALRCVECLCPPRRGEQSREIRQLLRLQGEQLVARLRRLPRPRRRLACAEQCRHGGARAGDIPD